VLEGDNKKRLDIETQIETGDKELVVGNTRERKKLTHYKKGRK